MIERLINWYEINTFIINIDIIMLLKIKKLFWLIYISLWDNVTDSTVLAYVLKTLNQRYDYGVDLVLLSVDEGITGYRDDSLEVIPGVRGQTMT